MAALSADIIVLAQADEPLDALVFRVLGPGVGTLEAVLTLNPNLADLGLFLPLNHPVRLPRQPVTAATRPLVQLWS